MAKARPKRRKKNSYVKPTLTWLRGRPRLAALLIIVLLGLCYLPAHAYRGWSDSRKFNQTRTAIDSVYAAVSKDLGQPDNLKRTNNCFRASGGLSNGITCSVETDFIYGVESEDQANVLLKRIQGEIKATGKFRPAGKLSKKITGNLVVDTTYYGALDRYSGPHHIGCTVKYSFATPEEVDLSLNGRGQQPFEVFFVCSGPAGHQIYPSEL